jgi:hypothetical protein
MQTIYRVQNEEQKGPYCVTDEDVGEETKEKLNKILLSHGRNKKNPTPIKDKGIRRYTDSNEYCGFKSMKQLMEWFTEKELKDLKKFGFNVEKIQGEIVAEGAKQILFVPS